MVCSRFLRPAALVAVACFGLMAGIGGCVHATLAQKSQALRRSPAYANGLAERLVARLAASDPSAHVGVHVVALADGQEIFSANAEQRFVPASTAKVLTAAAALHELGPQYRFDTHLLVDGLDLKGHSVRTVYLRGSGDPQFAVGDLQQMVLALRQLGVTSVTGELVIDDTAFDAALWARGWMWDDLAGGFSAPVSAVNVAGNALSLTLSPGRRGEPVRATQSPWTRYVSVWPAAETVAASAAHGLKLGDGAEAAPLDGPPFAGDAYAAAETGRELSDVALVAGQKVVITGTLAEASPPQTRRLAVRNPAAWASALIREQLQQTGIAPPSSWRRGATPPTAVPVAQHSSAELSVMLFDAMKSSNNHVLECVLKRMAADATGQPGTFAAGAQQVRRYLAQGVGLSGQNEPLLFDGSGSSRYNLVTPKQLASVVMQSAKSFEHGPELMVGLPVAGVDGTLVHRLRAASVRGRVRAKTGTMTGVSALTGILRSADDELLAFAIMMDHFVGSAEQARALQDDIVTWLVEGPYCSP